MTLEELNAAFDYLRYPNRNVFIEAEIANSSQTRFERNYIELTNNFPLPRNTYAAPYFVLPVDADKWGIELRIYFNIDDNIPEFLNNISTGNNRPGYEQYDRRINNNEVINYLFSRGFILGNQDYTRL